MLKLPMDGTGRSEIAEGHEAVDDERVVLVLLGRHMFLIKHLSRLKSATMFSYLV